MKDLKYLVRPNIQAMAAEGFREDGGPRGRQAVRLDANESPYNAPYNRYPDPWQTGLKEELAKVKGLRPGCMFLANGSEDVVDHLFRLFCIPWKDNVVAIEPTCGVYAVRAAVNDVEYRRVRLNADFSLPVGRLLEVVNANTKLMFLCSPNTPTGNLLEREAVCQLLERFGGMVVVDETYVDFARTESMRRELARYPNLIVVDSFSAAWASAGIRLGAAYAVPQVVDFLNRVKCSCNVSLPVQEKALEMLARRFDVDKWVKRLLEERDRVVAAFRMLPLCEEVFPTDANFFLARVKDAVRLHGYLRENGVWVKDVGGLPLCGDCLRITVGMPQENSALLGALRKYV